MTGTKFHIPLLLSAFLVLNGCQPPNYTIWASMRGAVLILEGRDMSHSPFAWGEDGIYADELSVHAGENAQWVIARVAGPECRSQDDGDPYPVTYGVLTPCWVETATAKPIVEGVIYEVRTHGLRWADGHFRIENGRAINLDQDGQALP